MLNVKNLDAFYQNHLVVKKVSFSIEKGEWLSIVGLNGAGKSTLVNALMGLIPMKAEACTFQGQDLTKFSSDQRYGLGIGCVLEGAQLFHGMSVKEHLTLYRYKKATIDVLALFPDLHRRFSTSVQHLSGGQQQMLAIAIALLANPSLLILDEPSLGLAPKVVDKLWDVLSQLHQNGLGILLIEQHVGRALSTCQKAIIMTNGVFVYEGNGAILKQDHHQLQKYLSFSL